jgi:hypothetical protein
MLIGFCGTGGTGKTTTAKLVAEKLGHADPVQSAWKVSPSQARAVLQKWGITEAEQKALEPKDTLKLQMEIWQAKADFDEQASGEKGVHYVCDRTPIDNWAYMLYRCGPAVTEEIYFRLTKRTAAAMLRYAAIYLFPLCTFPSSDDGVRDGAYGVRKTISILMDAGVEMMWQGPSCRISWNATPDQRAIMVVNHLHYAAYNLRWPVWPAT